MSHGESVARATQWLTDLVGELTGLRNATSRDPSFKNWRQNAITTVQRIWPADQEHAERFRRIPFSPVDPRADMRAQRESFSRGCQEAARVLNSFIAEVRTHGVPEVPGAEVQQTEESGFEDGFPTVDFPSGDLGGADGTQELEDPGLAGLPSQGADPAFAQREPLRVDVPNSPPASSSHPASIPVDARPVKKGLGVAAKLRDLLGLTGFTGKPAPPPARENVGKDSAPTAQRPRSLDIIAVGDEVNAAPRTQPRPASPASPASPAATNPPPAPATGAGSPPAEPGMSVVMSRPTTLRSTIGKVSIESLISPEFRGGAERPGATPKAAAPAAGTPPAASRPPLSVVPPLAGDPEFNVDPAPPSKPASDPPPAARQNSPSKVVPLPLPPVESAPEPPAEATKDEAAPARPISRADSAELTRATEDFMRTSPVLGATGRKVQRAAPEPTEHGFSDPDAIAIMSMVDELTPLGIPASRQSETRARLLDLARRIEAADLEWNALRKAVWFAMEYPEVARRLMPLLLPWIDRAA